ESGGARSFGLAPAFPSGARSYQALTFYPALTYGLDGDRIDSANFRIIGVGNRGLSGIVYRIKVACVCRKQSRRNAWGAGFGKIADAEFHARKIKWQPPISKNRDSQQSRWPRTDKKGALSFEEYRDALLSMYRQMPHEDHMTLDPRQTPDEVQLTNSF